MLSGMNPHTIEPTDFVLDDFTWTRASGREVTLSRECERPFKPRRLVLQLDRKGATPSAALVGVRQVYVGTRPIITGGRGVLAEAFGPNAFVPDLAMPTLRPGESISIVLGLEDLLDEDSSIVVKAKLLGDTVK